MGCYNEICSITGFPIHECDEVAVFVVLPDLRSSRFGYRSPLRWHYPVGPALLGGVYDDYGGSDGCDFPDGILSLRTASQFEHRESGESFSTADDLITAVSRRDAVLNSRFSKPFFRGETVFPTLYWAHRSAYDYVLGLHSDNRTRLEQGMGDYISWIPEYVESSEDDDPVRTGFHGFAALNGPPPEKRDADLFFNGALNPRGEGEGKIGVFSPYEEFWVAVVEKREGDAREIGTKMIDLLLFRWGMYELGIGWTPRPGSSGGQCYNGERVKTYRDFAEFQKQLLAEKETDAY